MSQNDEGGPQDQLTFQGSVTHTIPSEREVVGYSVSDYELDSLSTFATLTTVFASLAVLFLSVGLSALITLFGPVWLPPVITVVVGVIFGLFCWFAFHKTNSYVDRIRTESRPRSTH